MDPDAIGKDVKAYTLSNMTHADRGFGSLPSDEVPSVFVINWRYENRNIYLKDQRRKF